MKAKAIEKYRAQLQALLDRLDSEVSQIAETVRADARPPGEHDRVVSEATDKELVLEQNEEELRRQVVDALQRIEKGEFGVCTWCGAEISRERLDALPYAALCIDCERKRESAG
jgi:DnaK suppressor protein